MTDTVLPSDVARCTGKTVDGKLIAPCDTCAREKYKDEKTNDWRPLWCHGTPSDGKCLIYIPSEQ